MAAKDGQRGVSGTTVAATRRASTGSEARLLARLPDEPFDAVPAGVVREVLDRRAELEGAVIAALERGVAGQRVPWVGYRSVYLVSIVGEWRSRDAVPALLAHLTTPWGYGWDELVHAFARIGGGAMVPVLYAAFDRSRGTVARRRAVRALAAIAGAAGEFGDEPEWFGDAAAQRREAVAALHLLLKRREGEPSEIIDEVAHRLCDLQVTAAWDEIVALLASGALRERDGFTAAIAADLMHGRVLPFDVGGWRASMTDWMLRTE